MGLRFAIPATALLACSALASCTGGDDDEDAAAACIPEAYRRTCVADVTFDLYLACFDGRGRCTWSETRTADSRDLRFEWENGARFEATTADDHLSATLEGASGERCELRPSEADDCDGYRFGNSRRWYEYCVVRGADGGITGYRYTCDDGSEATITPEDLLRGPLMCAMQGLSPFNDCTDAQGRRFEDADAAESLSGQ